MSDASTPPTNRAAPASALGHLRQSAAKGEAASTSGNPHLPQHSRLQALRAALAAQGLDGFVVPLTDEHMSEYVGAYARRLEWLTGFTGSAGSAAVLAGAAAIAVDGRYTIQVRNEVDGADYDIVPVPADGIAAWLARSAPDGARIGYDPWLHTAGWVADTARAAPQLVLVPVATNPLDALWTDRPAPSPAPLAPHHDALAGEGSAAKRARVADWLAAEDADAVVVTALDSIAWLLNVRGADVAHTPVALSFALARRDGTLDLFVEPGKVTDAVRQHLGNAVRLHPRDAFAPALGQLPASRVAADPERCVAAVTQALTAGGATVLAKRDPVVLMKAIKSAAEIAGHRAASLRDGAALTRFLRWAAGALPRGGETERSAAARLGAFRAESGLLLDDSFAAISATGGHGAIPHYHATPESDAPILPGQLYLIDSGGQYADGTTDVTRVIPVGAPTAEMRDRFTRVLKAHIAIATAVFPDGTLGGHLDALARRPLWEAGLDYAHGTGHGIGSYLAVHEGPQRIAAPDYPGGAAMEPLRAGMLVSNEPGYYKAGEYGIRIENLVLIEPREVPGGDPERRMLGFATLTLAPIDRDLVDPALLTTGELAWLNAYHARVAATLGPALAMEERSWLEERCAALG